MLSRILQAVIMVFVTVILVFLIIRAMPGDPAIMLAGEQASPQFLEEVREHYGLNRPLYEQLIVYLGNVFRGDLGYSFRFSTSVWDLIVGKIPATMSLIGTALTFASIIGIILGVVASKRPFSKTDNVLCGVATVFYSTPFFWLAQMLLIVFAFYIPLFPVGGMMSLRSEWSGIILDVILDRLYHLVLPATALALWYIALIFRLTRASMLEALKQDYIIFARAKGLKERTVLFKHALRNALFPVITVVGMYIGVAFVGALFTETAFGWPGLGRLLYESVSARDYPVLTGIFIFVAISVNMATLIVDILYGLLDPRIRYRK